jgi:hypothetical protein
LVIDHSGPIHLPSMGASFRTVLASARAVPITKNCHNPFGFSEYVPKCRMMEGSRSDNTFCHLRRESPAARM